MINWEYLCIQKKIGTPASKLPDQVHYMTKKSRRDKIMNLQKEISKENLEKNIGKTYEVLIESTSFDNNYYVGRTYMDVPEEDGVLFIKKTKEVEVRKFCKM